MFRWKNKKQVKFISYEWQLTHSQAERPGECKQQPNILCTNCGSYFHGGCGLKRTVAEVFGCSEISFSLECFEIWGWNYVDNARSWSKGNGILYASLTLTARLQVSQSTHSRRLDKQEAESGLKEEKPQLISILVCVWLRVNLFYYLVYLYCYL